MGSEHFLDTQRTYAQAIKENLELQDIRIEDDIEDKWNKIEILLQGAATKIIKRKQKKEEKTWFDKECQEAVEEPRDKKLLSRGKKAKRGVKKPRGGYNRSAFYKKLLNKENDDRRGKECIEQARTDRMETIDLLSLEDVERVIVSMEDNKSAGENGISSEMIKRGGDILQS
ncbi:hypothetical protein QE152_g25209 [Popillia japonica]|uniref:Uncharacterized protein n=1 Tax=Popillia japonica TaxID=7064 RepID=A0AAW1K3H9_POPJA